MGKFLSKNIYVLVLSCLFLAGCTAAVAGSIGSSIGYSFNCDPRYKEGEKGPFFKDVQIPDNRQKAVIVLYQPFFEKCGYERSKKRQTAISVNGEAITNDLKSGYFIALLVAPQKVRFSAARKTKTPYSSKIYIDKAGELEVNSEAGKKYFLRWSNHDIYIYGKGFTRLNEFQLVDEKTASKELKGSIYLAPRLYKAPVFDKKTGEAL